MSGPSGIPLDASPYDLANNIIRDGRPRDAANQKIRVNDVVRIWTPQSGWGYNKDFFVKHILPKWSAAGAFMRFTYLLVPQLDEAEQATSAEFTGDDAIEITPTTIILITALDFLAIREGIAQDKIRIVCEDFQLVRMRVGEFGVIYNTDAGETQS